MIRISTMLLVSVLFVACWQNNKSNTANKTKHQQKTQKEKKKKNKNKKKEYPVLNNDNVVLYKSVWVAQNGFIKEKSNLPVRM